MPVLHMGCCVQFSRLCLPSSPPALPPQLIKRGGVILIDTRPTLSQPDQKEKEKEQLSEFLASISSYQLERHVFLCEGHMRLHQG